MKKDAIPLPEGFPAVGSLVEFYDNGTRFGYLEDVTNGVAIIRPIAAFKASVPRLVKVSIGDVSACST